VELNPFKLTRRLSWGVLRLTGTAGLAQSALEFLMPSVRPKTLLGEEERKRQRDMDIVRGLGECSIMAGQGKIKIPKRTLDSVWTAIHNSEVKVEPALDAIDDPLKVRVIRHIKPAHPEATALETESAAPIINDEI
jgi:hypothetical protein